MLVEGFPERQETAVLCSGGLDSIVLVADEARRAPIQPVYVSVGLAWERAERDSARRALARLAGDHIRPLALLRFDMRDLYPATHWAIRGVPPAYDTPDEDVYVPGRNVTLLSKAAVFCALRGIHRIAIGPLAGNPFPDATHDFFAAIGRALSLGLAHHIDVVAPFVALGKADVIRLGLELGVPLELTLSCMDPQQGRHCSRCSKCRERRHAFRDAGVIDRTDYVGGT
ncbi:MAG: 7-cyano-7-deazaguanine synthase [Acidobacteria bacterium]|nr:7-cyano-7-deazaguanine synthase [Acidobacteriota bacterium]